jgi:hypothetical protein
MIQENNIDHYDFFINLSKQYENAVNNINLNIKKKNFKHTDHNDNNKPIQINSLDDMSDIMYNKKKMLNYMGYNKNIVFSDNYLTDIQNLLKTLKYEYFDDSIFKKVNKYNDLNRFNPKIDNEILFYNCLKRDIFNQTVFRNDIFLFEDKLKEFNKIHNKNTNITFYEDDDLKIIWFIISVY